MVFVRMILPAWLAGLHAALVLALLVLFLNPDLPGSLPVLAGLAPLVFLLSIPPALVWPLGYRFLRLFARRPLRMRGIPFKYLYGFACADLFLVSGLYGYNAALAAWMVPPAVHDRLRLASGLILGITLVYLAVVSVPALRRSPAARTCCHALALLLPAVLLLVRPGEMPLPSPHYTADPIRPAASAPRILVLGIEGATLDQVLPLVAQGKLPWFSRLLQLGAHGRLSPFRPCLAPVVWRSLWTGKLPYKHRILGLDRYLLPGAAGEIRLAPHGFGFRLLAGAGGLERRAQESGESRSLTFREILTRLGSDVRESSLEGPSPALSPDPGRPDTRLDRFLDPEVPVPPDTAPLLGSLRRALEEDQALAAAGLAAWRGGEARAVLVVLPGLDRISHFFLRYGMPAGFGDVPPEEVEKYGAVLERYYRFLDEWLGKFLEEGMEGGAESTRSPGVILVVSPFGIEPLPLWRRFALWLQGNHLESGYHARGPDGMILAAGPGIRHGTPLGKSSVLDLVPTLLYLYGLPMGMDMDGHPLTRLFEPAFTSENPILLIPSYEAGRPAGSEAEPGSGGG